MHAITINGKFIALDYEGNPLLYKRDFTIRRKLLLGGGDSPKELKLFEPESIQPIFYVEDSGDAFFFDGAVWTKFDEVWIDFDKDENGKSRDFHVRFTFYGSTFERVVNRGKRGRPKKLHIRNVYLPNLPEIEPVIEGRKEHLQPFFNPKGNKNIVEEVQSIPITA